MSKEMRKSAKPVETKQGIMYGLYKVYKQQVDGCPQLRSIISSLYNITLLSF